jgi:hypothetical protein
MVLEPGRAIELNSGDRGGGRTPGLESSRA